MDSPFLLMSKLMERFNIRKLINPYLLGGDCLTSAECITSRLNELRLETEQLVMNFSQKKAAACWQTYQYFLLNLLDELWHSVPRKYVRAALNGAHGSLSSAPSYTVMKAICNEIECLWIRQRRSFDLSQVMPGLVKTTFYEHYLPEVGAFLKKVEETLEDEALVAIILEFFESFKNMRAPYSYTFSDRACFQNFFRCLLPVLNYVGGEKSAPVRAVLMTEGFNYPPFVSYCIARMERELEEERTEGKKPLTQLDNHLYSVLRMTGGMLALTGYSSLKSQCMAWVNAQLSRSANKDNFEKAVAAEVQKRWESSKIKTRFTVKELGMLAKSFHDQNLFNCSREHLMRSFSMLFSTQRSEEMSEHSFSNAMYCSDDTVGATLIGYLETSIKNIKRRTRR